MRINTTIHINALAFDVQPDEMISHEKVVRLMGQKMEPHEVAYKLNDAWVTLSPGQSVEAHNGLKFQMKRKT